MTYRIIVYGKPVVQKRPITFVRRGRSITWDPTGADREALSLQLLAERVRAAKAVLAGDVSLKVSFYLVRHGKRVPDVSNMLKALEDSGNGVLWLDDSQIFHIDVSRYECEESEQRTEVEITGG